MGLFFKSKYDKNLNRFLFYIDEIVNRANARSSTPDCMPYLKPTIDMTIKNSRSQIENWDASTDVSLFAYKVLYNIAFDVLSSGQLHYYRGELDPLSPADKLQYIVEECLDEYVKRGIASEEDKWEQLDILRENISNVG